MPIFWECDRCTACCRWPGQVRVTGAEVTRMAVHLGLTEDDFIQRFTQLNHDRTGLALIEHSSGACIFLDGADCRVQPVKPQQCRDFPNLWNFPGFEKVCRAKPHNMSLEDWRRSIKEATGRDIPDPPVFQTETTANRAPR